MKIIAVCTLFVLAIAAAPGHEHHHQPEDNYVIKSQDDLVKFRTECVEKGNIPADVVEKYKKWQFDDDEKTRCYMKCVFENFGLFNETHGFDVYKAHIQLVGSRPLSHTDTVHQKIKACADNSSQRSDACTRAYSGGMCFIKENLNLVQERINN